ncbi:MAG: Ig-like domain-containing protein [Terracidiphilus sp.]
MRGLNCRGSRLGSVAGLGITMALAVLPAAASAQQVTTHTSLTVETSVLGGHTQATASVAVTGADGMPPSGAVIIEDGNRELAEAALNSAGEATPVLSLAGGDHALRAVYTGDASHLSSASVTSNVSAQTSSTPNFALTLAPVPPSTLPLTLTAGQAGTIAVTVVPEDNSALTAPMFVTLSCSNLPSEASCAFTPATLEILPTTPTSCPSGSPISACPPVSSMLLQTSAQLTARLVRPALFRGGASPVAWAILLPGMLGLGGLAWGARRRRWLQRLALLAFMGLVTVLGTTACKPLYDYYQHGPPHPPATPSGTYTVTVTGQSTNGVSAITNNTTMVLTVTGGS